jgi:hypothetical protein
MDNSEIRKMIQDEVKRQMNVIIHGAAGANDSQTETISQMFPGMTDIPARPVMHPYGFSSRATPGTIQVVGRVGEHIGNRMVLGHRDGKRPADLQPGEVVLYNSTGQAFYIRQGKVQLGSGSSSEPMVLGNVLMKCLTDLMAAFTESPQVVQTAVGPGFLDPAVRQKLMTVLQTYIQTASTNVVSQLTFTERGGS